MPIDREIEDAKIAVGGKIVAIYRVESPRMIVERRMPDGKKVRIVFSIMRDAEGNGPGALFTDAVPL